MLKDTLFKASSILATLIVLASCSGKQQAPSSYKGYESAPLQYSLRDSIDGSEFEYSIDITAPKLDQSPAADSIRAYAIYYATSNEGADFMSLAIKAAEGLKASWREELKAKPEDEDAMEVRINTYNYEGGCAYEDDKIYVQKLNEYIYEGGAHGNFLSKFIIWDKSTAQRITKEQIFGENPDTDAHLKEVIIRGLMKKFDVNTPSELEEACIYSLKELYVSPNIRVTSDSLFFFYNACEIAPHVCGDIEIGDALDHLDMFMDEGSPFLSK